MCKKNFVTLSIQSRKFKVLVDDMIAVHTAIKKKRPHLPAY
jgi:hypothetical protein